jgi:hypothetical protein
MPLQICYLLKGFVERRRVAVDDILAQFIDQFFTQPGRFFRPFVHKLFFGGAFAVPGQGRHAARDAGRSSDNAVDVGALTVGAGRCGFVKAMFGLEGSAAGFAAVIIKGHGVPLIHASRYNPIIAVDSRFMG